MAQFVCPICNEGFEQKSRFDRHMAASHPKRAPSAADIERALKGIDFPKQKRELLEHAQLPNQTDHELINLLEQLPERTYRDAAEIAIALGELKSRKVKTPEQAAKRVQPSQVGGKRAAHSATSAASVAKIFSGISFPKKKAQLKRYAERHRSELENPDPVIDVIDHLPPRMYSNMADVEKEVGKIL